MWWGLAAGQWLLQARPQWLCGPAPALVMHLALLGRWSLSYYMLHQPLLMGALTVLGWLSVAWAA
jgi:uncharacterized membrane protein